jgi:hypothetical protein
MYSAGDRMDSSSVSSYVISACGKKRWPHSSNSDEPALPLCSRMLCNDSSRGVSAEVLCALACNGVCSASNVSGACCGGNDDDGRDDVGDIADATTVVVVGCGTVA